MAAAEARAAWQRAANRCFVQEDAKRAPKLACYPPTSTSKHIDTEPVSSTDTRDNTTHSFMPLKPNTSRPNLSPDSRWWLQLQPNHSYSTDVSNETPKNDEKVESFELIEMDPISKNVDEYYLGGEKSEVWWRTADKDDLASFVAMKSVGHIENCDLPEPMSSNVKWDPYTDVYTSSGDRLHRNVGRLDPSVHRWNSVGKKWASVDRQSKSGMEKPISDCASEPDRTKAQLLEALRHSQTRAREADKAAKQAHSEKEHILKLFFRQASILFAYKQWFQLLQLENLYFNLKNNGNQPVSSLLPPVFPWGPKKIKKVRKKAKRAKRTRPRCDISKYAVVFALGLGLVGAGILIGWTVGWMLPALYAA